MRLIDADKLYPDCRTIDRKLAISQSQLANAPTVPLPDFKDGYKQAIIDGKTNFARPLGEWVGNAFNEHHCNKCGHPALWEEEPDDYYENLSDFCPNCGADMRGGIESVNPKAVCMVKCCDTCKHKDKPITQEPCFSCETKRGWYEKWEAKEND